MRWLVVDVEISKCWRRRRWQRYDNRVRTHGECDSKATERHTHAACKQIVSKQTQRRCALRDNIFCCGSLIAPTSKSRCSVCLLRHATRAYSLGRLRQSLSYLLNFSWDGSSFAHNFTSTRTDLLQAGMMCAWRVTKNAISSDQNLICTLHTEFGVRSLKLALNNLLLTRLHESRQCASPFRSDMVHTMNVCCYVAMQFTIMNMYAPHAYDSRGRTRCICIRHRWRIMGISCDFISSWKYPFHAFNHCIVPASSPKCPTSTLLWAVLHVAHHSSYRWHLILAISYANAKRPSHCIGHRIVAVRTHNGHVVPS